MCGGSNLSTDLLLWGIYIKKCISPVRICLQTRLPRPYIRLRRKFPRPAPCKRACRSPGGEPEPTPLRGSDESGSQPSQQKSHPEGWLFCWLGWPDSNRRVPESKSGALPLGDIPMKYPYIVPQFSRFVNNYLQRRRKTFQNFRNFRKTP